MSMATSLVHDVKNENWAEARPAPGVQSQWLIWTLLTLASVALLGAFLFFVLDDYTLRNVIAVH